MSIIQKTLSVAVILTLCACVEGDAEPDHHDHHFHDRADLPRTIGKGVTLDRVTGCSLAAVRGLDQQVIDEMNCMSPNTLVSFADLNVELGGSSTWPLLQPAAREAFGRAIQNRGIPFRVNSAYRTIVQQYLLYRWYLNGNQCGIQLAARPGRSNHQSGLAVDVSDYTGWRPHMEGQSWDWLGNSDPVHFDYRGGGTRDIRDTAVEAFQRLWNRNHPADLIDEDGQYGPQTEARLRQSPAEGFATGADCDTPDPEPDPIPDPGPEQDSALTAFGDLTPPIGQDAALFEGGSSRGIFDAIEGQRFSVGFTLRNGAARTITDQVLVGFEVTEPFLAARGYTIESDFPARDGRSFQINDANDLDTNPAHDAPGAAGLFNLLVFSPGESKRLTLELEAAAYSIARPEHAHVRLWVKHIGGYYGEMDGWDDPVEVNLAGALMRHEVLADVCTSDQWSFEGHSPEDTEAWQPCNNTTALRVEGGLLIAEASGERLCLESPPWTHIDAMTYPGLLLRAGHEAGEHDVRLIWRRADEDWPTARALRFSVPDGPVGDISLDLGRASDWSDTIEGLRLLITSQSTSPRLILDALEPLAAIPGDAIDPEEDNRPIDTGDTSEPDPSPDAAPDPTPVPDEGGERTTLTKSGCATSPGPRPDRGLWLLLGLVALLRRGPWPSRQR